MLKLKNLYETIVEDFKIVALVQGESGSGKTTFASTFPNPIFLDCDDNLQGVKDKGGKSLDLWNSPENMFIQEFQAAIRISLDDKWCKTIILDSLSTFSDMLMTNVQINSKSIGKSPTQHDYLTQMTLIRKAIYDLKKTGKNIVLTCHVNIDKNEQTGRWRALPLVTGKLAQRIGGLFQENYITYTDIKDGKSVFKLRAIGDEIFSAKSLIILDKFKDEIINPSYSKILEYSKYALLLKQKADEDKKKEVDKNDKSKSDIVVGDDQR